MANGSVTETGLREAFAAVEKLPYEVTTALRVVAKATAGRIAGNAAAILQSKTDGTGGTARSIRVLDESADQQYTVNVPGDGSKPANLPMWLEYGTRFMAARPYLRPAGDAEHDRYISEMSTAAETTVKKLIE